MEGDESCVSLVGRWICFSNGWWDFKVDKTRLGKCINCGVIYTFKSLEETIRRRFSIFDHEVFVGMSYWADDVLVRLNGQEIPPTEIKDDWSFRIFKSLLRSDSSVNLFVTLKSMVDGQVEFLAPLEIAIPPSTRGFPLLQGNNNCREMIVANTVKELQPCMVGVHHKASVHHENGSEVHQELSSSIEKDLAISVPSSSVGDIQDTEVWGDIDDNTLLAHMEEIEARFPKEYPDSLPDEVVDDSESNADSNDCSQEDDSEDYQPGSEGDYDSDFWTEFDVNDNVETEPFSFEMNNDDSMDPPPRKVQRYTDLLREMDDFVNPPPLLDNPPLLLDNPPPLLDYQSPVQVKRKRVLHKELSTKQKKGQSVALKKGIELSEIYGFEDVEPMFIDTDTPDFRGHNIDLTKEDDVMYRGRVFETKDDFKIALSIYAINQVFRFRFVRYHKCYLVAQCYDKKCDWRVYAHQIGDSDEYEVRKVKLEHVCDVETRGQFTKHATSKVIAALLRSKYVNVTAGPRARDLPKVVLDEYNVTASYWKCWKAKELAISSAQGTEENSYLLLPLYLHLLQLANPGTIYHLETEDDELGDERFKFAFVSLGASIQGLKFIRRVVVVDGTHLQGKYNGCLLTASGQDANFQVFPIAFTIVDSENHDSWTWFMEKLKDIVGDGNDLTIISDRHQSIYHAKFLVYPQAHHVCCLVHLRRNVRSLFKGMSGLVWQAGEMFRLKDFKKCYAHIKRRKPECWEYLEAIGVEHWTRVHCRGERYNLMTSNIAESLNNALLPARDSPVVALIEFFRKMLSRWFEARRKKVSKTLGLIPAEVEKVLMKQLPDSAGLSVRTASAWDCEVTSKDGQKFHVSLEKRTCTCCAFQLLQIPCTHAMAAAHTRGLEYRSLVGYMHKKETWAPTFDGVILPVQDPSEVRVPDSIRSRCILPPKTKRPPGRPAKLRIPSTGEFEKRKSGTTTRKNKCGRCNGFGHNRVRCTVPLK